MRTGYEYKVIEWSIHDTLFILVGGLNEAGKEGWQIVSMYERGDKPTLLVFMQRPLYDEFQVPQAMVHDRVGPGRMKT